MILHVVAILLILGLAYLLMMQGLFSSLIMAVCSIFSLAVATALFSWFAATTELYKLQPTIAEAVSFSLLFAGPLIGLRFLADKFIRSDIYFDVIVDRAGGAIFGLFSGTVMVGALLVVIQLAPFGRVVWGDFSPFTDALRRDKRVAPFFPDDFVVGFGKCISAGSMSAGETWADQHDNLLLEAFCARNTAGRNGRTDVTPGAIQSVTAYDASNWAKAMENTDTPIPTNPVLDAHESTKVVVIRTAVNVSAADDPTPHWWRLPATHFRLLCREMQGNKKVYVSYYPVGYVYYDLDTKAVRAVLGPEDADGNIEPAKLILERPADAGVYGEEKYGTGKIPQDKINLVMDWIYVLPRSATPETLFFRRVDIADVPRSAGAFNPSALREYMLTTPPPDKKKRR
ncbi:MAG: CvpA family protein [Phycisphaerae bacterium]|nr:CvpA family protein [Phycisphaerae bacterium]